VRRVVAEVHDIDGRLDATVGRLAKRGYGVRVHQEPGFSGGSVHIVVADRD
jgi:31-O-methyltransferase